MVPTNTLITPKQCSLVTFFSLAFGISWAFWIPAALASYGFTSFQFNPTLSSLLGAFGPFIAAIISTAVFDGKTGFSILFKHSLRWRVGIQWYLFVLLWPAILSLAKTAIAILLGSALPDFSHPLFLQVYPLPPELTGSTPFLVFLPFVFLQQTLLGSSMGEEIGWRGYALPRMQARQSSLFASLLLGFLWGIWHIPLWLTRGHPMQEVFFGWQVLELMGTAVLFTWIYNNTQGSLLLALLFHTSIAITGLFLASAEAHPLIEAALTWGMAVFVIIFFKTENLSREVPREKH